MPTAKSFGTVGWSSQAPKGFQLSRRSASKSHTLRPCEAFGRASQGVSYFINLSYLKPCDLVTFARIYVTNVIVSIRKFTQWALSVPF